MCRPWQRESLARKISDGHIRFLRQPVVGGQRDHYRLGRHHRRCQPRQITKGAIHYRHIDVPGFRAFDQFVVSVVLQPA